MGNNVTSFRPNQGEMTPDRALEILYDTLTQQTPDPVGGDGLNPLVMPGSDQPAGFYPARHARLDLSVMPGLTGHLSYSEWCRRLGLPRHKLDRYLRKELGCSGQELVSKLYSSR